MDYLHFGNRNGEKLVILPGLSLKSVLGAADAIKAAYKLMASEYDIYLFDHIKEEPEGYSIEDMARDTLASFDELGLRRVYIMGMSMGGMLAQNLALLAPKRVAGLVLCSTAMNCDHANMDIFDEWQRMAEARDTEGLMRSFGENVYTQPFYSRYKEQIIASGAGASDIDYKNFLVSLKAVRNFDISKQAGYIYCPVLVVGGGEDRIFNKRAFSELSKAVNDSIIDIFPFEGHAVYDEAGSFQERVMEFLENQDAE